MKKLLLALLFLGFLYSNTQAQQVDWLKTGGGSSNDAGMGIDVDQNGNNYAVGVVVTGTAVNPQFGSDTISAGKNNSYDGYIVKYDVNGNQKWTLSFGAVGVDFLSDVRCIGDTAIAVVGMYRSGSVKMDTASLPAPPTAEYNLVVAVLDTAGNVKWTETAEIGNAPWALFNNNYNPTIDVNSDGNIVVGGSYRGAAKFGTTNISTGSSFGIGAYFASYSVNGNFNWVKDISPSTGFAYATRVTIDEGGSAYASGVYSNSMTVGSTTISASGARDVFLLKVDTGGNVKWLKTLGGTSIDDAYGLSVDKFNNLYIGGRFQSSFKVGDSTLNSINGTNTYDAYLVRLDTAGNYVWGRAFGGYTSTWQNQDFCYGVDVDNLGNVGVSGRYGGNFAKFGKDTVTGGAASRAIFTSLVDSTGEFIWTIRGVSTTFFNNQANGIALDTSKNIYVTGIADPPMVFEDKVFSTGAGFRDAYTLKIADCSEAIKAKIFAGTDTSACSGDSVKLWSNNDPRIEYRWLRSGFGMFQATDSVYKVYVTDNYSVAVNDEGCLDTSGSIKVTINRPTKPTLSSFPVTCVGDPDFTLSNGSPQGGKYNGIGVKNDTVFSPSTSGIGSFNLNYVYTDTNGCVDSANKNINVGGQSAFFTLAKTSVCQNEPAFSLSGGNPTGGTYFGPGVSSGQFNPAATTVGVKQLGYAYTSLGCSDTAYQNITVLAAPTAGFSSLPVQCASTFSINLTPYGTPTGGTFFGTGVIGTTFYPLISGAGSFTLSYRTNAGTCSDTATRVVVVDPVPNAALSAFSDRCADASSFTLTGGTPSGGVYLYNGNVVTTFDPSSVGVGTYTIKYAFSNGCGSDTATQTIKVNPLPTVTLAAQSAVCAGAPAFTLTGGSPVGGTYSGTGVNSTTGVFTPATAGAGTHTITYSFTDGNSCSNSATQNITVDPQPTVTIGTLSAVCIDNGLVSLTSGSPTPGTYSGPGVSGTNFNPVTAGVGTHTIRYTHTDGNSCTDSASTNITVNALPSVSLSAQAAVCVNASPVTLSGGSPTGGTYSGTGVNSTTGVFTPSTAGVGTHKITYTYSDANGCEDTASQNITVNPLPTVTLSALSSVCAGAPAFTLTGGSPVGGTYSGTGVNSTTGVFTPATAGAGTHTITYSFTDGNSCSNSATQNITVDPQPTVTIGTLSAVCIDNGLVSLTSGSPTPGTYSGPGVSGTNFNPVTAGVGTHTIRYTHTDGNSCTDSASTNITVNALPSVSLSAQAAVCVNASPVTLSGGSPTGGTYSGTGVNSTTGVFTPTTAGVGTHKITYTYSDANGCEDTASQTITVNPLPTVTLSALASVCAGAPAFSLTGGSPVGGTYSGTGVNSTTGVFTPAMAGAGTHTITYSFTDGNSCSSSATQNITVNPQPTVTIGTLSAVCIDNGLVSLTSGSPTPGTYSGPGVSGMNFNPLTAGVGTHTIRYTHTDGNSCTDSASTNITVNALPSVSLSAQAAVCVNASPVTLSGGSPTGGTYSGTGVNRTTGVFTPTTAGVGTHKVTYTYSDANGCEDTASQTITVNPLPTVTLSALASVCAGAPAFSLTGGSPTGGTYSGTGVNSTTGVFTPAMAGAGTHTITYSFTDGNSCSSSATQNITVYAQPTVTLGAFSNVCANSTTINLTSGAPAGGTYSGPGVSSTTFNPSIAGAGTHTIKYEITNANNCTDSATQQIVVDSVTVLAYPALTSICRGSARKAINTATPIGGSYKGTGVVNDTLFDPIISGTGTFTLRYVFTNAFGCMDSINQTIGVDTIPTVSFSIQDSICENSDSLLLTGTPAGGIFSGSGVNVNKFGPTALNGNVVINYLYTGLNGCSNSAFDSVRVDSVTNVSFSIPDSVCVGSSAINLNGQPMGGIYKLNGASYVGGNYNPVVANIRDTMTYAYTNSFGCMDSIERVIRIDSVTQVSISGFGSICQDDTVQLNAGLPTGGVYSGIGVIGNRYTRDTSGLWPITYKFTNQFGCVDSLDSNIVVRGKPLISLSNSNTVCANTPDFVLNRAAPSGGVYKGVGIVNDTIFSAATSGAGVFNLVYTVKGSNACIDSVNFTLSVDTVPTVSLDTFSLACRNAGLFNLTEGAPTGGVYFGSGVTSGTQFDPSIGHGIYQVGYRYTDANGCQDSTVRPIEVDTLVKVVSATIDDVCKNAGTLSLTPGVPDSGRFIGTGMLSINTFNPVNNPVGANQLYYILDSRCGTDSLAVNYNVQEAPKAILDEFGVVCDANEGIELTQGTPKGGRYFVDGVEAGFLTSRVGRVNVEYIVQNPNGCADTAIQVVDYNTAPEVTVVGDKAICAGDSAKFRVEEQMATYIWSGDTGSSEYILPAERMTLGTNSVKLEVVDSLGCIAETEVKVQSSLCGFLIRTAPNPNDGVFTLIINTGTEEEIDIAIWNSMGQRISGFNTVLVAGKNEFLYDMLDSAPGAYLIEVLMGQERYIEKFIIK